MKNMLRISLAIVLAFCAFTVASAQVQTVTGKVTASDTKKPMSGVKVTVKGTSRGTFTRQDGSFSIAVPADAKTLVFEYIGFKKKEVPISSDNLEVALVEDVMQLEELVVTAVGIKQEKKAISYATQEVKGEVLQSSRPTNVVNALAGQVAGVQINSSSGTPGASSYIRIRGVSSLTGQNQPLFVIDGIPINNDAGSVENQRRTGGNQVNGTDFSNRALDINPDDIESINVLKGAAATALYGLLASPGAIVITTKRGREASATNITYSYNISFDEVNKLPPMQNRYAQGANGNYLGPETGQSSSWGPNIDTLVWNGDPTYAWDRNGAIVGRTGAPAGSRPVTPYDPYKFFRTGVTQQHNLNMSGGSNVATYFASVSHLDSRGVVPNSAQLRTTFRLNADYKAFDDLTVAGNVQYARLSANRIERGSNTSGVTLGLFRKPPTFDDANGLADPVNDRRSYIFGPEARRANGQSLAGLQRSYRGTGIYDNPYWVVNNNPQTDNVDRLISSMEIRYQKSDWFLKEILGDVNVTLRAGNDWTSTRIDQYFAIGSSSFPSGRLSNLEERTNIFNGDLLVTFNKDFSEDLRMNLILGGNMYQRYDNFTNVVGNGFTIPEFYHLSNTQSQLVTQFDGRLRRASLFGRIGFDYKGMIYLNGNIRNDQSTTLPVQNNSFVYGGADLGIILSSILGLEENSVLPYAKLRASYATVGSDAPIYSLNTPWFRPTAFSDGWTNGVGFPFRGQNSFLLGGTLGSPDLRPESRREWEIGLELKFFQNMFGIDITYYNTTNIDQIISVPIARSTGYNFRSVNAATMENSGLEILLTGTPIRAEKPEDFQFDFTVNFSTFNNLVTNLAEGVPNILLGGFTGSSVRAVAGRPYGSIFGFPWRRNDNGEFLLDQFGRPQPGGQEIAFGSAIPNWIAGFRPQISVAGFTLAALLDVRDGGVMWNGTRAAMNFFGTSGESQNRESLDGVIGGVTFVNNVAQGVLPNGQANTLPIGSGLPAGTFGPNASRGQAFFGPAGFYNNFSATLTEPFIESTSWIRLRELTLSYRFPKAITNALVVTRSIELFATARNLWLSTDYKGVDPETSLTGATNAQGLDYFNFPNTKTYTLGIKVGF
jgi:TonB-linked SusC/RagA family outer membrane protein